MDHHGLACGKPVLTLAEPHGQLAMLDRVVDGPRAWTRETVSPTQWTVRVTAPALAEINSLVRAIRAAPLPLLLLHPDQFGLAACRDAMAQIEHLLTRDMGLAVLEELPTDIDTDEARAISWVLGYLLSKPVPTKWDGTMLYDVIDSGRALSYGVRGSSTNGELSFHTDNAFGVALPTYVGLLCIQPAIRGGASRVCSLYAVHNRLLRSDPRSLRRLYQPAYYDRQAEHAPGAPRVLSAPMFRYDGERLHARLAPRLVRRGYEMVGTMMDDALVEALASIERILADENLSVEFTMRRGQIQYVDNRTCAHFRSAFTDGDDPARKRHFVRMWYRESGGCAYDG